jgi:hypothetical protein
MRRLFACAGPESASAGIPDSGRFAAAVVAGSLLALLAGATGARAADVGANDDSAKHDADGGAALYRQMGEVGLRQTVIGVRFKPSESVVIQEKALLDKAIPNAFDAGLRVVLGVYPYPPREIEAGLGSPSLFASYVAAVARAYPQVRQFVIGNEPNQPAFWRPQFKRSGANASAPAFGPYLAAAYDALKAIDPALEIVGIGLSPRGNDKPKAKSNVSTSPIRFLRALGAWYRASGRTRPLMDSFSFHPYPNRATDPLDRGYGWPNAGFVNLDRIKQALWDAFRGTAQPTTATGLRLHLDEIGWQVDTSRRTGYHGAENVPVTDELTQAAIYGDLVRRAACDPDVDEVSFFGFRDDGLRTGFQAALHRADGTPRPAAAAVQTAIEETAAGCPGTELLWTPSEEVAGARVESVDVGETQVTARIRTGEDAQARTCVRSLGAAESGWAVRITRIAVGLLGARCTTSAVVGLHPLNIVIPTSGAAAGGRVEVTVALEATANRSRRTVLVEEAVG